MLDNVLWFIGEQSLLKRILDIWPLRFEETTYSFIMKREWANRLCNIMRFLLRCNMVSITLLQLASILFALGFFAFLLLFLFPLFLVGLEYFNLKRLQHFPFNSVRCGGSWHFRASSRGGLANLTPIAGIGHLISAPKFKIPTLPPKSLKWLFFYFGIPKKFQEHDILKSSLLRVNNQDLVHTLYTCTAGSIKLAVGIGNWAIVSYCLVVTQGNHCIVWYAQMPNSQPFLNQLYTV